MPRIEILGYEMDRGAASSVFNILVDAPHAQYPKRIIIKPEP